MSDMHDLPTGITTGWQEKVAALEADKERMVSEFVIENGKRHELESALASERAARTAAEALLHKLMLVVDDDEQIYNKDTDHERLMRAKRLIATHWGLDDFEWEPDE